jgi:hypothetical protein
MSTYHLVADVQKYLPTLTIDATSRPTQTQVQEMMDDVERYINGALKQFYFLPLADADALSLVGDIAARLSAARVWRAKFYGESPGEFEGNTTYADRLEQGAEKCLQRIRDGEDVLGLNLAASANDVVDALSTGLGEVNESVFEVGVIW